jgi:hypothetical protein
VKLFIDEDTGTLVARALHLLNVATIDYVGNGRSIRTGTKDEDWIPYVGRGNFLLISCNKGILDAEEQRELLIEEGVRAVFLETGGLTRLEVMRLILRKWEWLEEVWTSHPKPCAYILRTSGRTKRVPLMSRRRPSS